MRILLFATTLLLACSANAEHPHEAGQGRGRRRRPGRPGRSRPGHRGPLRGPRRRSGAPATASARRAPAGNFTRVIADDALDVEIRIGAAGEHRARGRRQSDRPDPHRCRARHAASAGSAAAIMCAGRWWRGSRCRGSSGVDLEASGDARISGLNGGSLALAGYGSGSFVAEGSVDALDIRIQGSGDANLEDLRAREARILINGSGDASAHVTDTIIATVNGTGEIVYRGEPRNVTEDVNGTGRISRRKRLNELGTGEASMWRNYMTVGVRALVKNKTYAFINIFGLGDRPRRLPDAAALRPLRDQLRQLAAECGEHLPVPEPLSRSKQTGEERHLQMTSYVAGQRLKADFPQVERIGLRAVERAGGHARRQGAADRGRAARRQSVLRRAAIPARPGRPAHRARTGRARSSLTQSEARRAVRPRGRGRPDADHGLARHHRPTIGSPASPATCRATAMSASPCVARVDMPDLHAPSSPQFLTAWGWQSGWYLFHAAARHRSGRRSSAQLPAWERRNIPDQMFGQAAHQPGRRAGLAGRQHPRHPSRRGPGSGDDARATTGARSSPSRSSPS